MGFIKQGQLFELPRNTKNWAMPDSTTTISSILH
jgi:hypothetical protein